MYYVKPNVVLLKRALFMCPLANLGNSMIQIKSQRQILIPKSQNYYFALQTNVKELVTTQ